MFLLRRWCIASKGQVFYANELHTKYKKEQQHAVACFASGML